MFVSVRMQFHNRVDTQPVKRFDSAMRCIYDIKFGMLQVRKNRISLRKYSGGSADLRALEQGFSTGINLTYPGGKFNDAEVTILRFFSTAE